MEPGIKRVTPEEDHWNVACLADTDELLHLKASQVAVVGSIDRFDPVKGPHVYKDRVIAELRHHRKEIPAVKDLHKLLNLGKKDAAEAYDGMEAVLTSMFANQAMESYTRLYVFSIVVVVAAVAAAVVVVVVAVGCCPLNVLL